MGTEDGNKKLMELAEEGDLNSQRALALLYELGLELEADQEKALYWWVKAANNGDSLAQFSVSEILKQDEYASNPDKLAKWTRQCKGFSPAEVAQKAPVQLKNRVLIVDDARFQCDLITKVCEMKGFETLVASSGESALEHALKYPDIRMVFLDLVMPGMNGLQFLKTIRKMRVLEGVPVIIISQSVSKDVVLQLKKLEINSFQAKPITRGQIESFLQKIPGSGSQKGDPDAKK